MPRFGSFCSESVLRVPNETSFLIVASMLRASISRTMLLMARLRGGAERRAGWARTTLQFTATKITNRLGSFMMDVTLTHRFVRMDTDLIRVYPDFEIRLIRVTGCGRGGPSKRRGSRRPVDRQLF